MAKNAMRIIHRAASDLIKQVAEKDNLSTTDKASVKEWAKSFSAAVYQYRCVTLRLSSRAEDSITDSVQVKRALAAADCFLLENNAHWVWDKVWFKPKWSIEELYTILELSAESMLVIFKRYISSFPLSATVDSALFRALINCRRYAASEVPRRWRRLLPLWNQARSLLGLNSDTNTSLSENGVDTVHTPELAGDDSTLSSRSETESSESDEQHHSDNDTGNDCGGQEHQDAGVFFPQANNFGIDGGTFASVRGDMQNHHTHIHDDHTSSSLTTTTVNYNNCTVLFNDLPSPSTSESESPSLKASPPASPPSSSQRSPISCRTKHPLRKRRWSITRFTHLIYHHYLPMIIYPQISHWTAYFIPQFIPQWFMPSPGRREDWMNPWWSNSTERA
ncbi:hypothetical protein GYMLUDRAFT_68013 [Collybiopsis luxurians FD-317 M1]|nr:hypothetical protein GYMLUDRAFT_68013 [Collybiopsis luxurians FD-317 M1]